MHETIEINDLEKNLDKSISLRVYLILVKYWICSKGGNYFLFLEMAETIAAARNLKLILDFEERPLFHLSKSFN